MKNNWLIFGIGATVLLIAGGVYWAGKVTAEPEVQVSQEAKAEVGETSYDWGEIPINGGNVYKSFTVKNAGQGELQLYDVKTSCMCTEAQVVVGDETSPEFGMHGNSSWVSRVPAGGEAEVKVRFDPAYHGPSGVGAITRLVTVKTNDADHPELEFNLAAVVTN
jgi:hypothetical protein